MNATRVRVPYAEAAKALLRDTLLDAATDLLRQRPWSQTSMADIASAAGVSRQTLYKEFGSRQAFAEAYILREADVLLSGVEQAIADRLDDPRAAVAACVEFFLTAAAQEPLIVAIVTGEESEGLLPLVTNQAGPVLRAATARLGGFLVDCWPGVGDQALQVVAESVVRLGISHAASPTGSPQQTAAAIAQLVGPHLEELVRSADRAGNGKGQADR